MEIPKRIERGRLVLRRFIDQDFVSFQRFMQNANATRYLTFTDEQKTAPAIRTLFDGTIEGYDSDKPICVLAIALVESNEYVGMVGGQPHETEGEFEIFYNLLPEFWGSGYAAEAVQVLLDYLKDTKEHSKAVAFVHPDNLASLKLVQRLGMVDEGTLIHEGQICKRYTFELR